MMTEEAEDCTGQIMHETIAFLRQYMYNPERDRTTVNVRVSLTAEYVFVCCFF